MRIAENLELLRARFHAVRGERSLHEVGLSIGMTHITLAQFLAGVSSTRMSMLAKIEHWVEKEERAQQGATSIAASQDHD